MPQEPPPPYPPQYLEGLRLLNDQDFFESHDVLEELWADIVGDERQFYQGLIQVAVALFHFSNGNLGGARKLYHSSHKYLQQYPSKLLETIAEYVILSSRVYSSGMMHCPCSLCELTARCLCCDSSRHLVKTR